MPKQMVWAPRALVGVGVTVILAWGQPESLAHSGLPCWPSSDLFQAEGFLHLEVPSRTLVRVFPSPGPAVCGR